MKKVSGPQVVATLEAPESPLPPKIQIEKRDDDAGKPPGPGYLLRVPAVQD